jgi:hypothetical protein
MFVDTNFRGLAENEIFVLFHRFDTFFVTLYFRGALNVTFVTLYFRGAQNLNYVTLYFRGALNLTFVTLYFRGALNFTFGIFKIVFLHFVLHLCDIDHKQKKKTFIL